jgi:hypothetical protein
LLVARVVDRCRGRAALRSHNKVADRAVRADEGNERLFRGRHWKVGDIDNCRWVGKHSENEVAGGS